MKKTGDINSIELDLETKINGLKTEAHQQQHCYHQQQFCPLALVKAQIQ